MKSLSVLLITLLLMAGCRPDQEKDGSANPTLGDLQHEFVIDGNARSAFDRGLLLLHSFEYDDAREAFTEAREAAPGEVMAYWGEAMTHYKALWGLQDVEGGRGVIKRLGESYEQRMAKAQDDLERGFWEGIEILYGEGELQERNREYADHMAGLYQDFPDNQEVAAFYALGLMWADSGEQGYSAQSARIAEGILEENPNHPGALHYMIHAYDNPEVAEKAEKAADRYSEVAPDATHALHMPSHIYLAMGMWNNVVASNETSYAASVSRMERKGLGDEARGYHSYAWLHYGYLQQKRFSEAAQLLEDMYVFKESAGTAAARSYLIMMQNFQRVETGEMPGDHWNRNVAYNDLGLTAKSGVHFLNALMAKDAGNADIINQETDTLEMYIAAAELVVTDEGVSLCSVGPTRYAPNKRELLRARVMAREMNALEAMVLGDMDRAEEAMRAAVELEDELGPPVGPPDIPYSSYDLYGNWLLEQGRSEEAVDMFNRGLKKTPNRRIALEGKEKALRELDRNREADEVAAQLAVFVKKTEQS